MRVLRGAVIAMVGIVIGVTLWQAVFGDDLGIVLVGWAISTAGIFLIALTPTEEEL